MLRHVIDSSSDEGEAITFMVKGSGSLSAESSHSETDGGVVCCEARMFLKIHRKQLRILLLLLFQDVTA